MASPGGSHAAPGEENWAQCADAAFPGLEAYAHPFNRRTGGLHSFDRARPPHFSVLLLGDPRFGDLYTKYETDGRFNKFVMPEFSEFFRARLLARHGLVKYTIGTIRVALGGDVAAAARAHAETGAFINPDTPDPRGCLHVFDRLLVLSPAMSAARGARVKDALVKLCAHDDRRLQLHEARSSLPEAVVYFAWQSEPGAAADGGIGTRGSLGGAAAGGLDATFERMKWRPAHDTAFPDVEDAHVHSFDRHNDSRSLDCFDRDRPQHFRVLVLNDRQCKGLCETFQASDDFTNIVIPEFKALLTRLTSDTAREVVAFKIGIFSLAPGTVASAAMQRVRTSSLVASRTVLPDGYLHAYDRMLVISPEISAVNGPQLESELIAHCRSDQRCENKIDGGDGPACEGLTHKAVYVVFQLRPGMPPENIPSNAAIDLGALGGDVAACDAAAALPAPIGGGAISAPKKGGDGDSSISDAGGDTRSKRPASPSVPSKPAAKTPKLLSVASPDGAAPKRTNAPSLRDCYWAANPSADRPDKVPGDTAGQKAKTAYFSDVRRRACDGANPEVALALRTCVARAKAFKEKAKADGKNLEQMGAYDPGDVPPLSAAEVEKLLRDPVPRARLARPTAADDGGAAGAAA